MTLHESEDQDLEQAFAQLRSHDRRHTPDAGEVLARARAEVARMEAAQTGVARTDVAQTDVARTDVAQTDVARTDVARTDVAQITPSAILKVIADDDGSLSSPESGDRPIRRGRGRTRGWVRWGVPGFSVALAAALATLLLVERDSEADAAFDQVLASYVETHASLHSSTDALLRLPGDELLRTVPRIGVRRPAPRDSESTS